MTAVHDQPTNAVRAGMPPRGADACDDIVACVSALLQGQRTVHLLGADRFGLQPALEAQGIAVKQAAGDDLTDGRPPGADPLAVVVSGALTEAEEPVDLLARTRSMLQPDDVLLVVVPNIAHGTVRLAMLAGRSPHEASPLIQPTDRRFFTRESLLDCVEAAGFAIAVVDRVERPIEGDMAWLDQAGAAASLRAALARDPEALVALNLIVAYPQPRPELGFLQERMRAQALALEATQRELAEMRASADGPVVADLERTIQEQSEHIDSLTTRLETSARRESDLRNRLIDAHDQLLRRDDDLRFRWFGGPPQRMSRPTTAIQSWLAPRSSGDVIALSDSVFIVLRGVYARLQWVPGIRLPVLLYRRLRSDTSAE